MELGKDILAIAPDGCPCAYQLKGVNGGRLTLSKWRDEVEKQMYGLALGQVVHPSITRNRPHRSYLVINGDLEEEVGRAIGDFNEARIREGNRHLQINTIVKGELLDRFKKLQSNFWPTELSDTKTFLELFLEAGHGSLPRERLASLLESTLPFSKVNGKPPSKKQCARAITSCAILCSTATSSFSNAENHTAEIEGWTVFLSYALALAERWKLPANCWEFEVNLAMEVIYTALGRLCDELMIRNNFIEGSSLAETAHHALFVKIRITHALALMSIYGLWRKDRSEPDPGRDEFIRDFCIKHHDKLLLWGEHAVPQFLAYYFFLRTIDATCSPDMFLPNLIRTITNSNAPESQGPLFSPYYTIEDVLPYMTGVADEPLDDCFNEASYTLEAAIHLFVPRNWKQAMCGIWPSTTRITSRRFKPSRKWKRYFWHCEDGQYEETMFTPNQTWDALRVAASENSGKEVPNLLKKYPVLFLLFLCVFPHRLTSNGVRWLSNKLEAQA
jgi:hypothetical protein